MKATESFADFPVSPALKLCAILAFAQLALVARGAFAFHSSTEHPLNPILSTYGEMTGANANYGFFAPGVDSQVRAVFDVKHADGKHSLVQLEKGRNSEFYLRTGDIIENFYNDDVDDPMEFQRDLSSSLVGTVFARYPDAKSVTIDLDKFDAVTMAEYRAGQRPDWKRIYSATFAKRGPTNEPRNGN